MYLSLTIWWSSSETTLTQISSSNKFLHWLLSCRKQNNEQYCSVSASTYWTALVRNAQHPIHREHKLIMPLKINDRLILFFVVFSFSFLTLLDVKFYDLGRAHLPYWHVGQFIIMQSYQEKNLSVFFLQDCSYNKPYPDAILMMI